ncbi:hypothetical protein GIB67_034257, partial [Kingdonia uniflora]
DEEDIDDCDRISHKLGAPEYKHLIAIHAKKYKGGLKESLKIDIDKVGRLSLTEQALGKDILHHRNNLVSDFIKLYCYMNSDVGVSDSRFTHKNMLRVYLKGTRFDCSNYNPLIGWMHGCQMVAFNMQVRFFDLLFKLNCGSYCFYYLNSLQGIVWKLIKLFLA